MGNLPSGKCCNNVGNVHNEQQQLLGFLRQKFGSEAYVADAFTDLAKGTKIFTKQQFCKILKEQEYQGNAEFAFACLDADSDGTVTVVDIEAMQRAAELREAEGLRMFRDFLKMRFSSPEAAFEALGCQEGGVLKCADFCEAIGNIGFTGDSYRTFGLVDKDRSGEVTFVEFKAAMKGAKAQARDDGGDGGASPRSPRAAAGKTSPRVEREGGKSPRASPRGEKEGNARGDRTKK